MTTAVRSLPREHPDAQLLGVPFASSPIPQWYFDLDTLEILAVNAAAVAYYGYTEQEFLGRSVLDLLPPEDRLVARLHIENGPADAPQLETRVWRHVRAGGVLCHMRTGCVDLSWRGRRVRLVQAVEAAERPAGLSLATADGRPSAAPEMVLATVAHELRQPLGLLKMALNMLDHPLDDDTAERTRQRMVQQVARMTRLVADLLDTTRVQSGRLTLTRRPSELGEAVEHAVLEQRNAPANGVNFRLQLPNGPVWVALDPARFQQVMSNLLTNAARYSPEGANVWIRVWADRSIARVTVKDEGCGIDPEALAHIFEPYVRVSGDGGGLGLGLAIVRAIVEQHGGHITATSAGRHCGTEFAITLPVWGRA